MSELLRLYAPVELGPDGYPPEWHATIKHAVRREAGNRCVRCSHPYRNGEHGDGEWSRCDEECQHAGPFRIQYGDALIWTPYDGGCESDGLIGMGFRVQAAWRILTVHHLDGDKANCRWWNLVALCQRCHLQIQGRVLMARIWPWEHTEWFKPYVGGYYAHAYLDEDLSREETMGRLDELLGLERIA